MADSSSDAMIPDIPPSSLHSSHIWQSEGLPLRTYVEALIARIETKVDGAEKNLRDLLAEQDRRVMQEFAALLRAIDKAEAVLDVKLEKMNEMRTQILQERGLMLTRDTFDATLNVLNLRLLSMEQAQTTQQAIMKEQQRLQRIGMWLFGIGLSVIMLILQIWPIAR